MLLFFKFHYIISVVCQIIQIDNWRHDIRTQLSSFLQCFSMMFLFFQKYSFVTFAIGALLYLHITESKVAFDYACDPRSSETSCLLGCLGCFEYYGGHMYNMAACCQECKDTQSYLIDDGPVKCSQRFIKGSWMRRFGK